MAKKRIKTILEKRDDKDKDLTLFLESISTHINTIYNNMEHLIAYATTIANINASLINILIKKKVVTQKAIEKEYNKIITDLNKQILERERAEKESKNKVPDLNLDPRDIDFSNFDMSKLKVS